MIVFHHTSLAGLLPFLDGRLELIPRGFSSSDTYHPLQQAGFTWADADRRAAALLHDGTPLVQRAAAAFLSTGKHSRLRKATSIATLEFSATPQPVDSMCASLGLDSHVLDRLPHCAVVPCGAVSHEKLLEVTLSRRDWHSQALNAKPEAVLAFASTLIAARRDQQGAQLLVTLTNRLHNDHRLSIVPTDEGGLEPRLSLALPSEAIVEVVLHPRTIERHVDALALLLRQRGLSHMVLRRPHGPPVALDEPDARRPARRVADS